jgi:hypothetical protein
VFGPVFLQELLHLIIGFSVRFLAGQFHVHLVDIAISPDAEITLYPPRKRFESFGRRWIPTASS